MKRAAAEPAWTRRPAPDRAARLAVGHRRPVARGRGQARRQDRRARSRATAAGVDRRVRAATLDSLRAIMMIRAYRMRGHLKANLDPLGIATTPGDASELDPATYGFAEADYDRPIFLDFVLGLETATIREILEILRRTYCGNVGVQYMHISDPKEKALAAGAHRGPRQGDRLHQGGQGRHPEEADRDRGLREVPAPPLPRHQALRPGRRREPGPGAGADHQARRRAGREGHHHRHAAPRPAERARRGDGQALPGDLPRVPGRLVAALRRRGLGRREVPPGRLVGPRVRRQHASTCR